MGQEIQLEPTWTNLGQLGQVASNLKSNNQVVFNRRLTLNLNSFFSEIGDDYVEVIGREQIPDVLLKNRVIEMISKPFEEREKFQNTDGQQEPLENGIVVMKISEDGVLYDRLEIELPKHSTVKIENDSFVIKNRNFTITFHASFDGFSAVMPSFFRSTI